MDTKTCLHCGKRKPPSDFYYIKRSQTHDTRCKLCVMAYMKGRRQLVPGVAEAEDASRKRYREKRKEEGRPVGAYAGKTPEQRKKAYEAVKRWRARNSLRAAKEGSAYMHLRRSPAFRRAWPLVLEHYGKACLSCGTTRKVCFDHVVPLSQGGANSLANAQPLCLTCNTIKGATQPDRDHRPDRGAWAAEMVRLNPWMDNMGDGVRWTQKTKEEKRAWKHREVVAIVMPSYGQDKLHRGEAEGRGVSEVAGQEAHSGFRNEVSRQTPAAPLSQAQMANKRILDSLLANLPRE